MLKVRQAAYKGTLPSHPLQTWQELRPDHSSLASSWLLVSNRLLHHRWNRQHHRWCILHHRRHTGPYSLLSYSFNYNPDCPSAISLEHDQPQSDKLVHGPNFGITVHSGHLCRQHQFPACLFSPERLD